MYICMYFLKRIINTTFSLLKVLTKKKNNNKTLQNKGKRMFFFLKKVT